MTIVDTSVWINHFRSGDDKLRQLLGVADASVHLWVVGELACGQLKNRAETLAHLNELPTSLVATDEEVHHLIEANGLMGRGLGWIDCHLLASALVSGYRLYTHDRALALAASELGVGP